MSYAHTPAHTHMGSVGCTRTHVCTSGWHVRTHTHGQVWAARPAQLSCHSPHLGFRKGTSWESPNSSGASSLATPTRAEPPTAPWGTGTVQPRTGNSSQDIPHHQRSLQNACRHPPPRTVLGVASGPLGEPGSERLPWGSGHGQSRGGSTARPWEWLCPSRQWCWCRSAPGAPGSEWLQEPGWLVLPAPWKEMGGERQLWHNVTGTRHLPQLW